MSDDELAHELTERSAREDATYRRAVDRVTRRFLLSRYRAAQKRTERFRPNWSAAMSLFGLGSTFAWRLCVEEGIDPDGYTVEPFAPLPLPAAEGGVR